MSQQENKMTTYIARIALATLFTGTAMAAGLAHAEPTPASDPQFAATPQGAPLGRRAPFGYPVAGGASRTITIDQKTRYLNVARLETVTINAGGKSVTWSFDTLNTRSFPLSHILPGAGNVTVYVSESPQYFN